MVTIRAFRAIDSPGDCEKFIAGHRHVLEVIGVKKVTSDSNDWADNPAVYVIIVESPDGEKTLGGARIHAVGGNQLLPIEEATGQMDENIFSIVKNHAKQGAGELCGLWNSREVAGMGIGSVFLTRAAVTIATQINLHTLFALCAPYTVQMAVNVGYVVIHSLGNNGTFYYPKLDLLATAVILKDTSTLELATPLERTRIFDLRKNPVQKAGEELRNKIIDIDYNLVIPGINI